MVAQLSIFLLNAPSHFGTQTAWNMTVMHGKIEIKAQMGSTGLHWECLLIFGPVMCLISNWWWEIWMVFGQINEKNIFWIDWFWKPMPCHSKLLFPYQIPELLQDNSLTQQSSRDPWRGQPRSTSYSFETINKMVPIALYYHSYLLIFICFIYFSIYFCYVYELNCCFIAFSDRNTHGT